MSSLPIFPNPNPPLTHHKPPPTTLFSFSSISSSSSPPSSLRFKTLTRFASRLDGDDSLWLREEQRWLREEQRWLREEQRWARERDALLRRVAELELRIQAMDRRGPGGEVSDTIAGLIEVLKERSLIAETGSNPMVLEEEKGDETEEDEVVVERIVRIVAEEPKISEPKEPKTKKRNSLRSGSEGEEVRALQEALEKLGFYSGEEDIEYSSFSSGTESAVKTWQASLGVREDGIMTEQLLERLFAGIIDGADLDSSVEEKGSANGASIPSVTENSNIQEKIVKEEGVTGIWGNHDRVFLLGENRWEDPSRLVSSNRKANESKTNNTKQSPTKCIACRGEGRVMCVECDGTGEPNVEPQFLEWVDEGANCPYCEGLGHTVCDVCDGKTLV